MKSRLAGFALLLLAAIGFGPAPPVASAPNGSEEDSAVALSRQIETLSAQITALSREVAGLKGKARH